MLMVPIDRLVAADWNYKDPGTAEMMAKLQSSIARDKSAGVLAVRELPDGKLEVIDGNHRLAAVQGLGWTEVAVESFGPISQAEAVVVAQRRNFQWYADDNVKLGMLVRDVVLPSISLDELESFMPHTRAALENLSRLPNFSWESLPEKNDGIAGLSFPGSEELLALWKEWYDHAHGAHAVAGRADALALALRIALDIERGEDK